MLIKKKIPLLIFIICGTELMVYLWSFGTSTFDRSNFFSITSEFIFDKCARISGRVSSLLLLIILTMVAYLGLKKMYNQVNLKEKFLVLITLFSINHFIHLLYVIFRFKNHGKTISLDGFLNFGGTTHGFITFIFIILFPIILWRNKNMNNYLYVFIIFHLLNVSSFIIKTFYDKLNLPEKPAYHNQFGILTISIACLFIIYKVYVENTKIHQEKRK